MTRIWRTVTPLLAAIAFLEIGSGLLGVLIPYRAQGAGFSVDVIGSLGSAYYIGFVLGCVFVPKVVMRFGHIRTFTGLSALATMGILLNGLLVSEPGWFVLRALVGYCFAGLYLSIESWLNADSGDQVRGRVLAAYVIVSWFGVILGKFLFGWSNLAAFAPFAIVAAAVCVSTVLVAFTPTPQPFPPPGGRLRVGRIYRRAPIGLVGCVLVGAANGSFWSLSPIFIASREHTPMGVGIFIAAAVFGGAVSQWPLGWVSDRVDRRLVILAASLSASMFAAYLALLRPAGEIGLVALAFGFGASALPLYSLCVAHANDRVSSDEFVEVSGELLMAFGIGASASPAVAAFLMGHLSTAGLFYFTGAAHLVLAIYVASRIVRKSPAPEEEKTQYVAVPKSTQAAVQLDPRGS